MFTGESPSGAGPTFPLIRITLFGSFVALDVMVTLFVIGPGRLVSYFTLIEPFAPGAIGSLGQDGTVHPHEPFASEIINGALPVFVNSNVHSPFAPYLTFP